MTRLHVCFVFKGGRRARLADPAPGPREFFYGFTEMDGLGFDATLVEEDALGPGLAPPALERLASAATARVAGLNANSLARFAGRAARRALADADLVVATTSSQTLALSAARHLGWLQPKVLAVAMGMMPLRQPPIHRAVYRHLLRDVALAPISRPDADHLRAVLGATADVDYLPFGVDTRFWEPSAGPDEDYVLAIGNDPHRDWACLAAAWAPDFPTLRIVTRLPVPRSAGPVEVIAGDWKDRVLSDTDVRALFQKARFVVIALRDTIQPAGQSATLQAMACGKAVVLSDIAGLWDRGVMADDRTCVLVPPGSVEALGEAVRGLIDAPGRAARLGAVAREAVTSHLTVETMAAALAARIRALRPEAI